MCPAAVDVARRSWERECRLAPVQAGGGTVAYAQPDYEYRESESQARAVLQATELAVGQPDRP